MNFSQTTIRQLQDSLRKREVSALEIVDQMLADVSQRDGSTGAFLSIDADLIRQQAAQADTSLPLGGIPIAIKDNINALGEPCTCGSKFLSENYRAPYDAGVIKSLRAAGAILFGRTNMDEFAMGSATENSALKVTHNPAAPGHIPGGSSGGSAAAVAAGFVPAALGSDTGGSIRQPASHCGIVGLKPTYGRVSRYGVVAFASSLDQVGPMTRTVEDAALVLQAIAGHDGLDSTSANVAVDDYISGLQQGVKGLRLGVPKEYFAEGLHPAVREAISQALAKLEAAGATLVDISLPHTEHAVATYYIIAPAEASSNLSRFDGVRYGHRTAQPADILSLYQQSREEGFGSEVKRRILLGTYVLSSGYYDAYYNKAQKVRTLICRDFSQAFEKVDVILSPVAPSPARKLGECSNPIEDFLADACTIPVNLAGLPAMSVPLPVAGLPIGLQVIAPHWHEARMLRVAQAVELASR
ncbi:MAG: Asp-tRNA(Asn)/Glu-tRNA(Gln) amidotransferase subunit GatA [Verrucomicrobiota bacterium]|jgi:aspartyl-tRNA(Asn)/glutamyl-tRNA(Gln) amidotransferase subunit A